MRKLNWLLVIGLLVGTLIYSVFYYDSSRALTYLAVIPVTLAPLLLKKTKYYFKSWDYFWYYLFVFFAYFLGSVVNLYNMISWFDILIHFFSGIFTFAMGCLIWQRQGMEKNVKLSFAFPLFFCLCFVMFVASLWEFFEYGASFFLGLDLQHNIDTGVNDTMVDMLVAFLGGCLSGGIGFIIKKKKVKLG